MFEELLKEALKLKFSAAETVIDLLPQTVRGPVKSHQQKLFLIINETISEFLQDRKPVSSDKSPKRITIE